jgi:hypothetical protein
MHEIWVKKPEDEGEEAKNGGSTEKSAGKEI